MFAFLDYNIYFLKNHHNYLIKDELFTKCFILLSYVHQFLDYVKQKLFKNVLFVHSDDLKVNSLIIQITCA